MGWLKLLLLLLPLLASGVVLVDTPFHRLSQGKLSGVVRNVAPPRPSLQSLW
jgi:hypothetical protein